MSTAPHFLIVREAQGEERDWEIEHADSCPKVTLYDGVVDSWDCLPEQLVAAVGSEAIAQFDELGPGRWPLVVVKEASDWAGATDTWLEVASPDTETGQG